MCVHVHVHMTIDTMHVHVHAGVCACACACACARTLGALDPTLDPNPRALPNHPAPPPPPNQTTHPPTTTTTQSNQESTSIGRDVEQCLPAGVGVQHPEDHLFLFGLQSLSR